MHSPSILELQERYRLGHANPRDVIEKALAGANSNAGKNVYLARNEEQSLHEAESLQRDGITRSHHGQLLRGIPISLKDCFDLEGYVTTCGSKVLQASRSPANADSAVAFKLRAEGAVITGKTHLHQLAYGITGENPDFADCLQPANPNLLTGGSSSGAAASVQEGSAMAAIGTDTGGSIRVPAALCGLAGYRASITMAYRNESNMWQGAEHLAPSFDTIGWIYQHLCDGPLLGTALFGLPEATPPRIDALRVGLPDPSFLHDCEDDILATLEEWASVFRQYGAQAEHFDTAIWQDAKEIFFPLQANEASTLHPEPRDGFEPAIAERLRWGASLTETDLVTLRARLAEFRDVNERKLQAFDLLLLPSTPLAELRAGMDHSETRTKILHYTMPVSLLGRPAVTLPSRRGAPQLVGRLGADAELLALSATLARKVKTPL